MKSSRRTGRRQMSIPQGPEFEIPAMPNIIENSFEIQQIEGGEAEINLDEIKIE